MVVLLQQITYRHEYVCITFLKAISNLKTLTLKWSMVPKLIWVPDFFGPQEICDPRNLCPEKFVSKEIWSPHENHYTAFSCRDQISLGPNFSGPKFLWGQFLRDRISWGPNDFRDNFLKEIHSTYHSCCSRSCCCNLHCLLVTSKLGAAAETEAVVKFVEAETEAKKIVKLKIYFFYSKKFGLF